MVSATFKHIQALYTWHVSKSPKCLKLPTPLWMFYCTILFQQVIELSYSDY